MDGYWDGDEQGMPKQEVIPSTIDPEILRAQAQITHGCSMSLSIVRLGRNDAWQRFGRFFIFHPYFISMMRIAPVPLEQLWSNLNTGLSKANGPGLWAAAETDRQECRSGAPFDIN